MFFKFSALLLSATIMLCIGCFITNRPKRVRESSLLFVKHACSYGCTFRSVKSKLNRTQHRISLQVHSCRGNRDGRRNTGIRTVVAGVSIRPVTMATLLHRPSDAPNAEFTENMHSVHSTNCLGRQLMVDSGEVKRLEQEELDLFDPDYVHVDDRIDAVGPDKGREIRRGSRRIRQLARIHHMHDRCGPDPRVPQKDSIVGDPQ